MERSKRQFSKKTKRKETSAFRLFYDDRNYVVMSVDFDCVGGSYFIWEHFNVPTKKNQFYKTFPTAKITYLIEFQNDKKPGYEKHRRKFGFHWS